MATNKKAGSKNDNALGVAVGLSAVAAAVGAYFMYGSKKAAKNRKAVKSWMFKAKADVLEALENTQDMSKREYEKLQVPALLSQHQGRGRCCMKDYKRWGLSKINH